MLLLSVSLLPLYFTLPGFASPPRFNSRPYSPSPHFVQKRNLNSSSSGLVVDLGYSRYEGYYDEDAKVNTWNGIRYAQDTSGKLRWQAPRAPGTNRSSIIPAREHGSQCPQSSLAGSSESTADNSESSEDCLFLNVQSPQNATHATGSGLPVLVWIHPGGYGTGSGGFDLSNLMRTNGNKFIAVSLNYRLGAFGFLASDEVYRSGVVNAGILDQQLALQWVQQYIHLFGGDHSQVTIFGESAGAGSVMLHDIAYGGTLGTQLFKNSITSSPYLAFQYGYKDWQPSQAYYAFASAVGCDTKNAYLHNGPFRNNESKPIFQCLVEANSATLMEASDAVSQSGTWGTFPFLPVTDGSLIQDRPSKLLKEGRVNGVNHLAGANALEGAAWVPPNTIRTIDDLVHWLEVVLPNFSNNDIAKVLNYYPSNNASVDPNALLYSTDGIHYPTTINQSIAATGQYERAIAIYGEMTFICPSYWLAEAYSDNGYGGNGWKYQFSVPNAYHGADGSAFLNDPNDVDKYSKDFVYAFESMLGNFIVHDNPQISNQIANGITTNNTAYNPASDWPPYNTYDPTLLNFNATCPHIDILGGLPYCSGPGQENRFTQANAHTWEGGRGVRCDFWKMMGELVPE